MAFPVQENLETIPTSTRLKLYSYWFSSCAWRVRIALNLKGLSYEYKAVNLLEGDQYGEDVLSPLLNPLSRRRSVRFESSTGPIIGEKKHMLLLLDDGSNYTKLNPIHFVPTLVDGNIIVADSLAILLYLEDKYPEHPLLPDDLQLRALSLQATLETLLKNVAGKYCIGDQVTLADVFLAPQVSAAGRFNVDMSKFPTLHKINQALVELPTFQAAVPEKIPDYKSRGISQQSK